MKTMGMGAQISVITSGTSDPDRFVQIRRDASKLCELSLVDLFMGTEGIPFLSVEVEYATLVMTLGGACTAVKTAEACFAIYPHEDEVRITFQANNWPFPDQWSTPREEFNSAVVGLL